MPLSSIQGREIGGQSRCWAGESIWPGRTPLSSLPATWAPPRAWHPKGFLLREKVNFRFLILRAADAQWLASYPPTCSSSRCLSSVNPGSLPPQGPYSSPLLSSAAHTHTYSPAPGPPQATCAQRRSHKPAATKGLMPEAERRLRACWELRALLGSVVPHAGGKASTGWSPRVGGWGVGKASVSHLAGRWRKNLVPAARRQRVPGSGLRSWVPADSDCEKPRG